MQISQSGSLAVATAAAALFHSCLSLLLSPSLFSPPKPRPNDGDHTQAFGVYFSSYQYTLDALEGKTVSVMLNHLLAGGIAGSASWVVVVSYAPDPRSRLSCLSLRLPLSSHSIR